MKKYKPWEVWWSQVWHGFSFRQFRQGSTNHLRWHCGQKSKFCWMVSFAFGFWSYGLVLARFFSKIKIWFSTQPYPRKYRGYILWSSPAGSICMQNSSIHVKRKYLGQNDDVFTREFLFQFTDNLLLNLLPWLELWEWNKDGNSLATRSNVEFAGVLELHMNTGSRQNVVIN